MASSSTKEGASKEDNSPFSSLPEEIVEEILSYLSPFGEYTVAKLVCRLWYRLVRNLRRQRVRVFHDAIKNGRLHLSTYLASANSDQEWPSPRFSHSACVHAGKLYIFGGCSSSNTAFNDLFQYDLKDKTWTRIRADGLPPPPKECSSMVAYNNKIIVFGGWCQPARTGLNPAARFYNGVHIFDTEKSRWEKPELDTRVNSQPCERAGHSATVTGDLMVVFGGAERQKRFNDVWVLDLKKMQWFCPVKGRKPSGRFGHSQMALSTQHIIILGGCGGPNKLFGDVWLLNTQEWMWQEIMVCNRGWEAPQLWCHPAVLTGDCISIFSIPKQTTISASNENAREDGGFEVDVDPRSPFLLDPGLAMQVYSLDCSEILSFYRCSWKPPALVPTSPQATSLHSVTVCYDEIIIFGGIKFTDRVSFVQLVNNNLVLMSAYAQR